MWNPPLPGDQPNETNLVPIGTTDPDDVPVPQKRYRVELTEAVSYQIYVDVDANATMEDVHQQAIDEHVDGLSTEVDNGPVEVESIYLVSKAP
jgi:hypothetical protein